MHRRGLGTHDCPELLVPGESTCKRAWPRSVEYAGGTRTENSNGECLLVSIGAKPDGSNERVAIANGYRESKDSWRDLLLELWAREPQAGPLLAVGDGAMARWAALEAMFPQTRHQRCWFRKIGIVLSALPKSRHSRAKAELIPH